MWIEVKKKNNVRKYFIGWKGEDVKNKGENGWLTVTLK